MAYGMSFGGGGGAGAGVGGLAGFLGGPWGMALGLGTSLLGGLFAQDPMQRQQQMFRQALGQTNRLFDPNALAMGAKTRYNSMWSGASPAVNSLYGGQSRINQTLNSQLGARGLGTSGLGAGMRGAAAGWLGQNMGNLQSGMWNNAFSQENDARQQQAQMIMQAAMGGMGMPSMRNNLLGAWMGTGGQMFDAAMRARLGIR